MPKDSFTLEMLNKLDLAREFYRAHTPIRDGEDPNRLSTPFDYDPEQAAKSLASQVRKLGDQDVLCWHRLFDSYDEAVAWRDSQRARVARIVSDVKSRYGVLARTHVYTHEIKVGLLLAGVLVYTNDDLGV